MSVSDEQDRQPPSDVESPQSRRALPQFDATESFAGIADGLFVEQWTAGLPEAIGRYQVKRRLGQGSYGEVYEGWDASLQRSVAIKVLTTEKIPQARVAEWLREARTLAALDHPGIVPVYDLGQDSAGQPFIVSKLIVGGSLAARLSHRPFGYHAAARLVAAVARALDYAHRSKIVHRDVKPGNILIGSNEEPVLADFGLAIHESELGTGLRFVGTPAYMSPEQARREGHRVDGRTDIYSLGVVFYELLTGKRPFEATDLKELLDYVRHVEVRPPRQIDRGIPRELEWICLKALAKRATDRYSVAGDLADELWAWIATTDAPSGGIGTDAPTKSADDSTSSRDELPVSVIPRGLRPFNSADADFFLHLLPGPRDRRGLPESVRFWKTQIEKQDPGDRFRVGVLIGPSGSGKSSLVRAGIMPQLDPNITVLLIEARPEGFEASMHKRLRQLLPQLEGTTSLTEALIQFRRSRMSADGPRLLLVIDQFEQWLSRHDESDSNFVLEALRQCDGTALQALLLVRDDFTLALAEFMDRLEEPLLQNQNFATVDFFSLEHARNVLAAFGRAYGTVADDPTRDQQRFLDLAIDELETNGKVVPVQLALFADMVKERPWVPSLLRDFGGARGVGVAFLDDRLNGVNAHPEFRAHRVLVRRLLASLLPAEGVDVRPPARSRSELMSPLIELAEEATIERLISLLDSELRLVTPSVASESGSTSSDSSAQDPAIQLTHDYLVPSIRQWLDAEERNTGRGRAMIRLRELAQAWNAKPEPRHLPAWLDWATIHIKTKRNDWNSTQRRMMRAADRRVMAMLLFASAAIAALGFAGQNVAERWRADSLAEQIVNADVAEIAGIIARTEPSDSSVAQRLQQLLADLDATVAKPSEPEDTVRIKRRGLNIALVLARHEPAQGQYLVDLLPTVDVDDLIGVRQAWPSHAADLQEHLWSRFEEAAAQQPDKLLSFGAILAHQAPDDPRWPAHSASIVRQLAASRTVHIRDWIGHFQPLASRLGPELVRHIRGTNNLSDVARSNLLEAILVYCPSQHDVLAKTVASVRIEEFDSLLTVIDAAGPKLRLELRQEFTAVERTLAGPSDDTAVTAEVSALREAVAAQGGYVDARSGMAHGLSQAEFTAFAQRMTAAGYAPSSIRPAWDQHERKIASVWRRTKLASRVEWDLTGEAASDRDRSAASDGLWMEDFAWYPHDKSESAERRLVCLWVANHTGTETRCYFDRQEKAHDDFDLQWAKEGFTLHRYAVRVATSGARLHSAIWRKTSDDEAKSNEFHRYRRYFGDHEPGLRQTDLRLSDFTIAAPDRCNLNDELLHYEEEGKALTDQKQMDNNRLFVAKRLSAMGRFDEAQAIFLELQPRWERNSTFNENLAVLYARMGDSDLFQRPVDRYRSSSYAKPHVVRYLNLLSGALAADVAEVQVRLSELEAAREASDDDFDLYLRGLARVVAYPELGEVAATARQTLLATLRTMLRQPVRDDSSVRLQECDFDALREDPEIGQLLFEQGLSQLVTGAYREDSMNETRFLLSLSLAEHSSAAAALRQDGFLPGILEVHGHSSGGVLQFSSVWERQVTPVTPRIAAARARGHLAMTLARLGEDDLYVDGMSGKWGHDVQSQLILKSATAIPAAQLVQILRTAKDETLQRGLILTAGSYSPSAIPADDFTYLQSRVRAWAESGRNAGVRQAACWCLTKWEQPFPASASTPTTASTASQQEHLDWFTNSLGQTLIVLEPPDRFLAGSPSWELDRKPGKDESLYWIQIGRNFAISATETTIEQFAQFLSDPRVRSLYKAKPFTYPARAVLGSKAPQISVSWLDAVRFCQWLSEKEGVPETDWCYPGVLDADGTVIQVPKNFRDRRGYRLPTEAEWEFAARGGSQESRHCGYDAELLSGFEWLQENAGSVAHPVATLRPNPFGLFDVLGNAFEWSDGFVQVKHTRSFTDTRADELNLPSIPPPGSVHVRGGRYNFSANSARAAERDYVRADDYRSATSGFRVTRTMADQNN